MKIIERGEAKYCKDHDCCTSLAVVMLSARPLDDVVVWNWDTLAIAEHSFVPLWQETFGMTHALLMKEYF